MNKVSHLNWTYVLSSAYVCDLLLAKLAWPFPVIAQDHTPHPPVRQLWKDRHTQSLFLRKKAHAQVSFLSQLKKHLLALPNGCHCFLFRVKVRMMFADHRRGVFGLKPRPRCQARPLLHQITHTHGCMFMCSDLMTWIYNHGSQGSILGLLAEHHTGKWPDRRVRVHTTLEGWSGGCGWKEENRWSGRERMGKRKKTSGDGGSLHLQRGSGDALPRRHKTDCRPSGWS